MNTVCVEKNRNTFVWTEVVKDDWECDTFAGNLRVLLSRGAGWLMFIGSEAMEDMAPTRRDAQRLLEFTVRRRFALLTFAHHSLATDRKVS